MKDNLNLCFLLVRAILLQVIVYPLHSQNIIPNPSFEIGDCQYSYTRRPHEFRVSDWHMADSGTPDYFNKCSNRTAGVPYNWAGVGDPADGDSYIGIYLKKGIYQENIGVKLSEPLKKGVKYYGRFSIATVANAEYFPCEISLAFTHDPMFIDLTSSFDKRQLRIPFPDHEKYMDFSWHVLEFSHVATGNENYLYIGSLTKNTELCEKNKYRVRKESMLKNASYVFLDDFYFGETLDYQPPIPSFEFASEVEPINILFDFDEDFLTNQTISVLDSLVNFLHNSDYHLLVTGGTDSRGTNDYNLGLGLRRADAVSRYLTFHGLDQERIGTKSIGETNPTYPNHSEETRSLNRSALIEFYKETTVPEN